MGEVSGSGGGIIPFHIVIEGACWLKLEGTEVTLETGDVVMFPFGTEHQLGAGRDGMIISPIRDLPPGHGGRFPSSLRRRGGRRLCAATFSADFRFAPFSRSLPKMIHVKTRGDGMPVGSLPRFSR
jgi:hypothetical protein